MKSKEAASMTFAPNTSDHLDWHFGRFGCPSLDMNYFPHPSDLALLCKYQGRASRLLCFCKASSTLLTFIYICCQRITFLSYERLSRPACLNVVTHKFIIRPPRTKLKGPICDPSVNKRVAPPPPTFEIQDWNKIDWQQAYLCHSRKITENIISHLHVVVI